MKEDLLKIINHYGVDKQLKYIHSEYFELDEAIIEKEKVGAYPGVEETKHIAEEIADIMVMLEQFRLHYGINKETIDNLMEYKIKRQIERIEEEGK